MALTPEILAHADTVAASLPPASAETRAKVTALLEPMFAARPDLTDRKAS